MKQIKIILPTGKVVEETKEFGDRLLRSGAAVEVKGEAGTIRLLGPKKVLETTP
jgi:hypothetical protein